MEDSPLFENESIQLHSEISLLDGDFNTIKSFANKQREQFQRDFEMKKVTNEEHILTKTKIEELDGKQPKLHDQANSQQKVT